MNEVDLFRRQKLNVPKKKIYINILAKKKSTAGALIEGDEREGGKEGKIFMSGYS